MWGKDDWMKATLSSKSDAASQMTTDSPEYAEMHGQMNEFLDGLQQEGALGDEG